MFLKIYNCGIIKKEMLTRGSFDNRQKNIMEEVLKKLAEQQEKIDAMYVSVEKLRKYFLWTLIITIVTVVLPLVALIFAVPFLIGAVTAIY